MDVLTCGQLQGKNAGWIVSLILCFNIWMFLLAANSKGKMQPHTHTHTHTHTSNEAFGLLIVLCTFFICTTYCIVYFLHTNAQLIVLCTFFPMYCFTRYLLYYVLSSHTCGHIRTSDEASSLLTLSFVHVSIVIFLQTFVRLFAVNFFSDIF